MSLYSDYVAEYTHGHVYETDKGFAEYIFRNDKSCYIKEIFVKPEFRKQNVASDIADAIAMLARAQACDRLIGSVVPSARGSTASLKVLLAYGFKLDSSTNDFILFKKELT